MGAGTVGRAKVTPYFEGLKLFAIQQPLVVLLAAYSKFTVSEFIQLAKYLFVLSVRYNIICNDSPNEQEKKYNKMAVNITNGEYKRASHVKNGKEFKELYPTDERFKSSFQHYKMPNRRSSKKIRFLLSQIEIQNGREIDYEKVTLEHVCPYNPDQDWQKAFGEGINDVSDRLGNMVLLDKDDLQRASFIEKQKVYQDSGNHLAQEVAKYQEWNLSSVNKYQEWLALQAVQTWQVD
ncbi:MAG: HNH endonuclease [Desulfamplus sp.]|nr:HNH endonuclease [Desulfamplus sp.]